MPEFEFFSRDLQGNSYKGSVEADDLDRFYQIIKERGQFCVHVVRTDEKKEGPLRRKIATKDLTVFCRQLSTMLNAGLTVVASLDILYQQTEKKRVKQIILSVYESVQRGDSLSAAMRGQTGAFPPLLLNMVESGEASGTLDSVMERMAQQYEKDFKLQNKVTQALVYPVFLSVLSVVVVVVLLAFIMPKFSSLFGKFHVKLPASTLFLLAAGDTLTTRWYVAAAIVGVIAAACYLFLRRPQGKVLFDLFKLRMPVFGKMMLTVESARFSRTMASLYSSGMPVMQTLEIAARVIGNHFIRKSLSLVNEDVRQGVALSAAVRRQHLFPPMLCSMLTIGEESGNMDDILLRTADFYDEQSEAAIARMVSLIEPVLIVVLALVIGFIIISVITPIYSLYSSINTGS